MTVGYSNVVVCDGKACSQNQDPDGTIYLEIGRHDKDRCACGEINGLYIAFPAADKHAVGLAAIFKRCVPEWIHFESITMELLQTIQPPLYHLIIGGVAASLWHPNMANSMTKDPFRAIDEVVSPDTVAAAYNVAYATWMRQYGGRPHA
jgi:hypothetical protein